MNETIERLFKASGGAIVIDDVTQDEWHFTENLDVEKFANLIIKECLSQFNVKNQYGGGAVHNIIKEHFGVA